MLVAVLAVALLHPLAQARVRPLYQASDEMAYLRTAQLAALTTASSASRPCIAPPAGVPLEVGEGGKRGYAIVTGAQLRLLCASGGPTLPLFALRAWHALALPVIALAAWYLARLVSGSDSAGLLAALVVAAHPVAAKYAGAVTPDAWANAFSAGALVALTRTVMGRYRWWDLWVMIGCALAGLLWKDTAHMLVPLAAVGFVLTAVRVGVQRSAAVGTRWWRLAASLGIAAVAAAFVTTRAKTALLTQYLDEIPEGRTAMLAEPLRLARAVVEDVLVHMGGILASSVLSLYRPLVYGPGASTGQPVTPHGATAMLVGLALLGGIGVVIHWMRPRQALRPVPAGVFAVWTLAIGLAFVQPSIRQVLLDINGLHQGRWLFPALAPVAACIGIGLASLAKQQRVLPLTVLACLAAVWLVVIDMVRHYYVTFPFQLRHASLFTRPTGDIDIGDAAVVRLIEETTTAQIPWVTWGILVLLVVASLALTVSAIRHAHSPAPHV